MDHDLEWISLRGVQYVQCVMHKCIMVKVGWEMKNTKSMEKMHKFYEIWGEFAKVGGYNYFPEIGELFSRNRGKCCEKGHQKFWRMKMGNFFKR